MIRFLVPRLARAPVLAGCLVAGSLLSGCTRAPANDPAVVATTGARPSPDSLACLDYETNLEIDDFPPPIADLFGVGVRNSDGCVAMLAFSGVPSATNPNPFVLSATEVTPSSLGWLAYTLAPECPLPHGTRWVQRPYLRSGPLNSGGTGSCGGSYAFDVNAVIQAFPYPTELVGVQVFTQVVYIDRVGIAQRIGLTNGVRFTIQP